MASLRLRLRLGHSAQARQSGLVALRSHVPNVAVGSEVDKADANYDVRYYPESDRRSLATHEHLKAPDQK